jgi:hypothetical protein
VSQPLAHQHPETRPDEIVFRGKSLGYFCLPIMLLALVGCGLAAAIGSSDELQTRLHLEPIEAQGFGLAASVIAVVTFCGMAWTWLCPLKWVAVSPAGIRWHCDRRLHTRRWDEVVRIRQGVLQTHVNGQQVAPGHYAEIEFRHGKPLRISPSTIHDYDRLLAALETGYTQWTDTVVPAKTRASAWDRTPVPDPDVAVFGPLRFDADGVTWDGKHRRWDEIENYEVSVGYLRILPVGGDEFLRRLSDLGDWHPAVARLDENVGSRRVGRSKAGL